MHLLPHIGAPLLDRPAADWLLQRITADGVEVFLEDTVERVEAGRAHLRGGVVRPFDLLIQAVGITPVFPEIPGLTRGQGIRIDERCRTSLPHVHAAGDCTERLETETGRWLTTRFWLDGSRQGRTAGSRSNHSRMPRTSTRCRTPSWAGLTAPRGRCTRGAARLATAR